MKRQPRSSTPRHRAGLAPVELVLVLPILAMLMALMINFGVAAAWKIRTQGNAHYAAFRSIHVRTGEHNPPPANWPRAALSHGGAASLPTVDNLWDSHPDLAHPRADWIRGDFLPLSEIHVDPLEFDENVLRGSAQVQRPVPLLRGALPNGQFRFDVANDILNIRWEFGSLGFGDNEARRLGDRWNIEDHKDFFRLDPGIITVKDRLDRAQSVLRRSRDLIYLYPLDRDVEFWIYRHGWREFHPRTSGCSLDVNEVQMNQAPSLSREIYRLPCTMSRSYLALYRMWICHLESCGADDQATRLLRERHADLCEFISSLPMDMGCDPGLALQPCEVCDPLDAQCIDRNEDRAGGPLRGCPAPTPDDDGL